MEKLLVGTIIDAFSLDGTVKVFSSTLNWEIRYKKGNKLLLKKEEKEITVTVESFRSSGRVDYVKFLEFSSANEALEYKGASILVEKSYQDLKDGEFFFSDLVGCKVYDEDRFLGEVKIVEEFPAQITLRVKSLQGKDFFIPFVKAFIKNVDIREKKILINYIEGLL